jgi:hypothetical protein
LHNFVSHANDLRQPPTAAAHAFRAAGGGRLHAVLAQPLLLPSEFTPPEHLVVSTLTFHSLHQSEQNERNQFLDADHASVLVAVVPKTNQALYL